MPDPDPNSRDSAEEFQPGAWRSDEPMDSLTRLADQMTDLLPDGVRAIIILDDGESGGMQVHNFESTTDAALALATNLKLLMQSEGGDIAVLPIPLLRGMRDIGQS